jgi:hypothetical protein
VNDDSHKFIQHAHRRAKRKTETRRSFYNRDDSGEKKAAATIANEVTSGVGEIIAKMHLCIPVFADKD